MSPTKDGDSHLILFLSSYPPRKCGIATFSHDLSKAIDNLPDSGTKSRFIAVDGVRKHEYPGNVIFQINENKVPDYIEVAKRINGMENVSMVSVQHEFKLYGSDHGENLLHFLEHLEKPVTTTFHTVLPHPSEKRKEIVKRVADRSRHVVVMAEKAVEILKEHYGLPDSKIIVIPHGVHEIPFSENGKEKDEMGYGDRTILTSFGFMRPGRGVRSSGRGYENVIEAMPRIIESFPNALYLIIGVTHPKTLKAEGEKYRESLERRVKELGLEDHVRFVNRYVSIKELFRYLKATDVYVCSSQSPHQITSGTLAYAMSCGRAIVSTPFFHAREVITPERGILLDEFENPELFADAVIKIISNPSLKREMEKNNYEYTRSLSWPKVASSYMGIFGGDVKKG